jgi:two-component system sensor histidine kinase/response regulator
VLAEEYASLPETELRKHLSTIARTSQKMGNIVEELLLLAGIRKTDVELEPLDMAEILAEVNKRLAHMIEEYQAKLVLPGAWPKAFGYAPWVEEIWVNYLSNAIKYGGRPPRVELGATTQADGMVRFWVRDNGPGLSQAEQSRLFVPFTKLAQVRVEGFGLGLSIVRRIVDKLGGQVGVESEGVPGRGSTFSFTLPSGPQDNRSPDTKK